MNLNILLLFLIQSLGKSTRKCIYSLRIYSALPMDMNEFEMAPYKSGIEKRISE